MFEYVSKSKYNPVRSELEDIIKNVQDELRGEITFRFDLIGSGSKKLITQEIGSNKGFDFDYNLVLQQGAFDFTAKEIRDKFMDAFKKALKGTKYNNPSSSKSAITIKVVDQENSLIKHSCDFGIVREILDDNDDLRNEINIFDKPSNHIWNIRAKSNNYADKAKEIKEDGLWQDLRDEYIDLKNNNNDEDKKSYQLYLEAINNIYNQNY